MKTQSKPWRYWTAIGSALALILIFAILPRTSNTDLEKTLVAENLPWSVRMTDSEIARRGNSFMFRDDARTAWVYETGLFLKAVERVWHETGDNKYFDYIKTIVDSYVEPDGAIKTYDPEEYNIDHVNSGKLLLSMYNLTKNEKYRIAALHVAGQLERHPRTKEGGFWHKKIYPWQMWLDGIYMGSPFYAEFAAMFNRPEIFDDVANQIIFIANHTHDPATGLFYHGWDESRQQKWADPVTGCSPCFWGRAIGWYAMGIVDVLDFLPADHPQRDKIISIFQGMAQAVVKVQDQESGLWYQVLDQGNRQGNYLEASASSMFVYALAKAIRKGYLGDEYFPAVQKGYEGIIKNLINVEPNGLVNLTQVCKVAGLGGNPYRDGSYEYYISTPIEANDLKGVGPFILAAVEMETRAHQAHKPPSN